MDGLIWECYGQEKNGKALVMARDRMEAQAMCRHWLGWTQVIAFRAGEELPTFVRARGRPERPVVFNDGEHGWHAVETRRVQDLQDDKIAVKAV